LNRCPPRSGRRRPTRPRATDGGRVGRSRGRPVESPRRAAPLRRRGSVCPPRAALAGSDPRRGSRDTWCSRRRTRHRAPPRSAERVGITRVHMEEDTGKTTHASATGRIHEAEHALVDYNRAGVPLVECVSEPDMRSAEQAGAYLRELRATLEALDVSDVRMEE